MSSIIGGSSRAAPAPAPAIQPAPPVTPAPAVAIEDEDALETKVAKKKKRPTPYAPVLTTPYGDVSPAPTEQKKLLGN